MLDFKRWQYYNGYSPDIDMFKSKNNRTLKVFPFPYNEYAATHLDACPTIWKQVKARFEAILLLINYESQLMSQNK